MSKLLQGSINLSKIDKEKLYTSDKKEVWLNVSVWVNDEVDNYGNIANIQQSTKKDESKIYLGNLKEYQKPEPKPEQKSQVQQSQQPSKNDDGLPF